MAAVADDNKNVGILALEVYTPRCFVRQAALEEHAGVAPGKYTIGLGQDGLALTGDAEDINSICLTAVAGLLEKCVRPPFLFDDAFRTAATHSPLWCLNLTQICVSNVPSQIKTMNR